MVQLWLFWNSNKKILQVIGTVVQRSGGQQHDFLCVLRNRPMLEHGDLQIFCNSSYLPELSLRNPCASSTMMKSKSSLSFVLIASVKHFRKTSVGDELRFFVYSELPECLFPVVFKRRRIDDQNIGVLSVGLNEPLSYHRSNHGLTQTYDISQEQAVMLHQHLVALYPHLAHIEVIGLYLNPIQKYWTSP